MEDLKKKQVMGALNLSLKGQKGIFTEQKNASKKNAIEENGYDYGGERQ